MPNCKCCASWGGGSFHGCTASSVVARCCAHRRTFGAGRSHSATDVIIRSTHGSHFTTQTRIGTIHERRSYHVIPRAIRNITMTWPKKLGHAKRGKQTIRILNELFYVATHRGVTCKRLAELVGASRRTVFRDLQIWNALGVPWHYEDNTLVIEPNWVRIVLKENDILHSRS